MPSDPNEELSFAYTVLLSISENEDRVRQFGIAMRSYKYDEEVELLRSLLIRPFVDELGSRISAAVNLATPEERIVQAVPYRLDPAF